MYMYANAQTYWLNHTSACKSSEIQKNIQAELSYEFGPRCLINLWFRLKDLSIDEMVGA